MLTAVLALATGLLAATDWYAVARDRRDIRAWAKPATLLALTGATIAAGALDADAGRWLVAALVLDTIGDVALLDDGDRRFLVGLTAFLLGHLAYLVAFLELGLVGGWWLVPATVVVVAAFFWGANVVPGAHRRDGRAVAAVVTTYLAVIGAAAVVGWATGSPWIAAGITVFLASDTTLGIDRFDRELRHSPMLVIVTYHVGQALIAVGVVRAL